MFRGFEGNERLVETVGLPIGLALAPISRVSGQAVYELVMTQILRALVVIASAGAGCADQGEAKRVVIGLVGAVLAIRQHRRAVSAAAIGRSEEHTSEL